MAKESGTDTETGLITYYDPDKGRYGVREWDAEDPFAHKDDFEWTMVDGKRTYTLKTDTPKKTVPVGDNNWDTVYEGTPGYEDLPDRYVDDSQSYSWESGDPSHYNPTGGINRDVPLPDGTQQGGEIFDLTPGYNPEQPVNQPTNSELYGPTPGAPGQGGIIRDPFIPEFGGGGIQNPEAVDPGGAGPGFGGELIGYQDYAPDQRDFYQQQFADMRARGDMEQQRAQAAFMRGQEAANAEPQTTNPWGWVEGGLPSVVEQGAQEGFDPNAYILNPNYGLEAGMTNNEIINRMGGIFGEAESNLLNKHRNTEGVNWDTSQYLGSGYDNIAGQWGSGAGGSFAELMNKILNNAYIQAGDAPTAGGRTVPVGYASPTNA